MNYLENLNEPQAQAVHATDGPVLVLAGAGTGKTRVLTTRLSHILLQQKAWPSQILAVTFTNKAANEMRLRVENLFGHPVPGVWLGTFHSTAARMLRPYAALIGLKDNFAIIDTDDQLRVLKQLLKDQNIDDRKENTKTLLGIIEGWKDRGLLPTQVPPSDLEDDKPRLAARLYPLYQEKLLSLNAADFGDLTLHNLTLFKNHPDVLEIYQNRFHYILVDEYQDTSIVQYLWLRLLAQKRKNICCVGDDDQSIYGWRGAEVGNILRFEHDFPGATVIRLEQNYRSTPHILGAAAGLIQNNKNRLGKTLWTKKDTGDKVMIKSHWNADDEASWVGLEMVNHHRMGKPLASMAVLVRASFQTREFEECFIRRAIPYRIIGGFRFYERQEIRDAIAYLRLVARPEDGLAFERIVNTPRRGVGPGALAAIHLYSRDHKISLFDATKTLLQSGAKGIPKASLKKFVEHVEGWRVAVKTLTPANLLKKILEESEYSEMWRRESTPEAAGRVENLKELIGAVAEFADLDSFLEHVSLVMENTQNNQGDAVLVMTMHSAKGLEFDIVFLTGWEEGIFPTQRSIGSEISVEEERRLAYVGITRAKERAHISFALNRYYFGQTQAQVPSRFISDLPKDHIHWLPMSTHQRQRLDRLMPSS